MKKPEKLKRGARANSGRKPGTDNKLQLYAFIEQSKVDKLGGKEAVKELMTNAVNMAVKNLEA